MKDFTQKLSVSSGLCLLNYTTWSSGWELTLEALQQIRWEANIATGTVVTKEVQGSLLAAKQIGENAKKEFVEKWDGRFLEPNQ